ncbi:low specificity L-threonine aldolase [Micromonospora endophytica]|uniref:Low specificity L-threonine aldolase n=1 Tax=Micromonospora endophytica TaxID=515350 RepID=A0A2W2BZT5_9ACTN|nr:GntG family PLP-dependent aldolase [Micromonospora endophytica]PZF85368.1 low specificity L-threonine aldolase [Micromonospora endophytica]RIW48538.1 aminotransferase class I/II-fold pyridoxal phosphate-dependent enzyme [Micromonospora endophytica]BCJ61126.1 threonine aldolase [Micromonospora endophytica]
MIVAEVIADLRSDTVTRPTAGMREAMATAEVGDDVYGEDPAVNALEAEVAALFGHEAALFCPTGSMANQIALQLLVPPGAELLCDADAHVVTYEMGAAAAYGGITSRTWPAVGAEIDPDVVAGMIRPDGYWAVPTRVIAVEQTHNRGGGGVISLDTLRELRRIADAAQLALHCDGARIWHAHVADGVPLVEYGALFDTLSVCLSKGLGAPVGSLVVGSGERIARARVIRKRMGGGMRQAGILAAAGRYALAHHVDRLAEDHAKAARLAEAIAPFGILAAPVRTNLVPLDLTKASLDAPTLAAAARAEGVLISVLGPRTARLVTHLDVSDAAITHATTTLTTLLRT